MPTDHLSNKSGPNFFTENVARSCPKSVCLGPNKCSILLSERQFAKSCLFHMYIGGGGWRGVGGREGGTHTHTHTHKHTNTQTHTHVNTHTHTPFRDNRSAQKIWIGNQLFSIRWCQFSAEWQNVKDPLFQNCHSNFLDYTSPFYF